MQNFIAHFDPVAYSTLSKLDVLFLRDHLLLIGIQRLSLADEPLFGNVGLLVDLPQLRLRQVQLDLLGQVAYPLLHGHMSLEIQGRPVGACLDLLVGQCLLRWPTSDFM